MGSPPSPSGGSRSRTFLLEACALLGCERPSQEPGDAPAVAQTRDPDDIVWAHEAATERTPEPPHLSAATGSREGPVLKALPLVVGPG